MQRSSSAEGKPSLLSGPTHEEFAGRELDFNHKICAFWSSEMLLTCRRIECFSLLTQSKCTTKFSTPPNTIQDSWRYLVSAGWGKLYLTKNEAIDWVKRERILTVGRLSLGVSGRLINNTSKTMVHKNRKTPKP